MRKQIDSDPSSVAAEARKTARELEKRGIVLKEEIPEVNIPKEEKNEIKETKKKNLVQIFKDKFSKIKKKEEIKKRRK